MRLSRLFGILLQVPGGMMTEVVEVMNGDR